MDGTGKWHMPKARYAIAPLAALLAIALLSNVAAATSALTSDNLFCDTVIPSSTQFGISGIVGITLLVLLSMITIVGLAAAIGYAFDITALKRFTRNEIGEIAITVIIAVAFIGTLSAGGSLGSGYVASASHIGRNVFYQDCNALSTVALYDSVPDLVTIGSYQDVIQFISTLSITYMPNGFGFSIAPAGGLSTVLTPINNMFAIAGALVGLLLAVPVILGIIYGLFPLFFYVGLVLRTMPWTRAAGGALLGVFIGLYIVFPLLLNAMMCTGAFASACTTLPSAAASNLAPVSTSSYSSLLASISLSTLYNISSFFITFVSDLVGNFTKGIIAGTISNVIEPDAFILFDVFISFIVALDFAEVMGDMLGAQSLSSSTAFKKLI